MGHQLKENLVTRLPMYQPSRLVVLVCGGIDGLQPQDLRLHRLPHVQELRHQVLELELRIRTLGGQYLAEVADEGIMGGDVVTAAVLLERSLHVVLEERPLAVDCDLVVL